MARRPRRRSHRLAGGVCATALALVLAAGPVAAAGLVFLDALVDGTRTIDGLAGVTAVAVTPDGAHVYAAAATDDAVAVLRRQVGTGMLAFAGAQRDGVDGVDGLAGADAVAVSPDGAH